MHRTLLFSGHMIDAPGRRFPRFPPACEPLALAAIEACLDRLQAGPQDLAICGGACGGDLLFAEAALRRGARLDLYLPFEPDEFVVDSIDFAGGDWRARFDAARAAARAVHVMPLERAPLPEGDNPYELNNLWMLEAAGGEAVMPMAFVCLWNGQGGDGPGGVQHMMSLARERGGEVHWLDTRALWPAQGC